MPTPFPLLPINRAGRASLAFACGALFLFAVGGPSALADGTKLCTSCFKQRAAPGDFIGMWRYECPCCDRCQAVEEAAQSLKNTYKSRWDQYKRVTDLLNRLRAKGTAVVDLPADKVAEQARLQFDLWQLQLQWDILKQSHPDCTHHMPGNVWDGTGGPVTDPTGASTSAATPGSTAAAESAAREYGDLADEERRTADAIVGFLGSTTGGYTAPPAGYNGERTRVSTAHQELADRHKAEAKILANPAKAPKDDKTFGNPVEPKAVGIQVLGKAADPARIAAQATSARLKANGFAAAGLEAQARYRSAKAAGDGPAMLARAKEAILFADDAIAFARAAAREQATADGNLVKEIDSALAKAAEKGQKLPELLAKFQAEVKANGLPAHYRDALKTAGVKDPDLDTARDRLLALKPADVEKALQKLRDRSDDPRPRPPDWIALQTQWNAALKQYHSEQKPAKK